MLNISHSEHAILCSDVETKLAAHITAEKRVNERGKGRGAEEAKGKGEDRATEQMNCTMNKSPDRASVSKG